MITLMLLDVLKVEDKKGRDLLLLVMEVLLQTRKSIVQVTQMIRFVNLDKHLLVVKDKHLLAVKDRCLLVVKDKHLLVV